MDGPLLDSNSVQAARRDGTKQLVERHGGPRTSTRSYCGESFRPSVCRNGEMGAQRATRQFVRPFRSTHNADDAARRVELPAVLPLSTDDLRPKDSAMQKREDRRA